MTLPSWAIRMKALQKEYEDSVGKTFHSTWDDFLFCKLCAEENATMSLAEWKRQQLQVESTWDSQEVANALNLPLGADIRKEILPSIKVLQEENVRLTALVKRLTADTE